MSSSLRLPGRLAASPELRALTLKPPKTVGSGGVLRAPDQYSHHCMKPGLNLISRGNGARQGPWKGHGAPPSTNQKVVKPRIPPLSFQLAMEGANIGVVMGELSVWSLEARTQLPPPQLLQDSHHFEGYHPAEGLAGGPGTQRSIPTAWPTVTGPAISEHSHRHNLGASNTPLCPKHYTATRNKLLRGAP